MCPPSGSPPATYDYNAGSPGTQGPTSPLLANHQTRSLRTHQLVMPLVVPLPELQAALPAGFNAIPNPAGSTTAQVAITFVYQQRVEITGQGTFGPASSLFVGASATNTALGRQESLLLVVFSSNAEFEQAFNGVFGPGSILPGEIEIEIKETQGTVSIDGSARGTGTQFQLRASATCPERIDVRVLNDPAPIPFRFMNGTNPNPAFRLASQADVRQLTQAAANARVNPAHGPLRLPGGDVTISSVVGATFARALEIFTKAE